MELAPEQNIYKGIIAGAVAGVAASFLMNKLKSVAGLDELSSEAEQPLPQSKSLEKIADTAQEFVGSKILGNSGERTPEWVGYVMGGVSGAMYGAAAEYSDPVKSGFGLPFGSAVWAVADDVIAPAIGISDSPLKNPISKNAYSLASRWIYGAAAELIRKQVRKAL